MLLEARCSLRFTKLEKRSPAMAKVEIRVPTCHPRPISAAQMDVANMDTKTPRMVFAGPNMGCPSTKSAPPEYSPKSDQRTHREAWRRTLESM